MFGIVPMSNRDIILTSLPVVILFLFFLVLCIRSIRSGRLANWQLVALIAFQLVVVTYTFFLCVGTGRYVGLAMSAAGVGAYLGGLFWRKRMRRSE